MNGSEYISGVVDCILFFFSFVTLSGILYMEGKKEIFNCVKTLSLIEKSLLSSLKQ